MSRVRPATLRDDLVTAALRVARKHGYNQMTRDAIAAEAGCSTGQVTTILGTMPQLRRTVMRAAVTRKDLPVIAQGVVARDPSALAAPVELRTRALVGML